MRRFKFIGNPDEYYWEERLVIGNIYPENFNGTYLGKDLIDCINNPTGFEYDPSEFTRDWQEVFLEENLTDSGLSFQELRDNVIQWAKDKNLLKPENHLKQFAKMVSEVGELGDALIKEDHPEVIDAIGDVQICLIILCEQLGLNPTECLESAWNVIKDRTGKTVEGTFIKD